MEIITILLRKLLYQTVQHQYFLHKEEIPSAVLVPTDEVVVSQLPFFVLCISIGSNWSNFYFTRFKNTKSFTHFYFYDTHWLIIHYLLSKLFIESKSDNGMSNWQRNNCTKTVQLFLVLLYINKSVVKKVLMVTACQSST